MFSSIVALYEPQLKAMTLGGLFNRIKSKTKVDKTRETQGHSNRNEAYSRKMTITARTGFPCKKVENSNLRFCCT